VDVQSGSISIGSGGTASGNFNMAAGAFTDFASSYTLNAGASVTGAGSARMVSAPTLTIAGATSVRNLDMPGGMLTGAGNLTVGGR